MIQKTLDQIKTKDVISQVKKIEISTTILSEGIILGNYQSVFKGNGLDFSQIREYHFGDDIRNIDWNVTARYNKPFIKEYEEERNLNIYFIFDFSASNLFGDLIEKKRKAIELCATIMFSAIKNNDNVGAVIFTENVEKYIPAKKGKKHILAIIETLISFKPEKKGTNIEEAVNFISKVLKKRGIIFFVSDFYNSIKNKSIEKKLLYLKKRHDIIAVKINDEKEKQIPNIGWVELEDYETGEQILIDTSDQEFRENYKKIIEEEDKKIRAFFKKHKIELLELLTKDSYYTILKRFFTKRKKRW